MAKETNIIFLYDTELLKREEDDPNSAILYFYPTWVSDQQKTALCGQLMGTILCLRSIFTMPKTISLQTGKFYLVENGRYIMVVGTDRNIPGWVLEHRATLIYSLINFFHKDFVTLAGLYNGENLNAKLYHIFETYLKLLFLGGCIFNHMPLLDLSKSGNDILTDVRIFLEKCKAIPNILGGTLLYHNKVIHTQLSCPTTKKIVFSDPFRIKSPAELSELNFVVPQGVKLLQVYIPPEEFDDLYKNSLKNINSFEQNAKTSREIETAPPSLLKRENSLLFTSVPEDETFSPGDRKPLENSHGERKGKKSRPNSLNLKSCSLDFDIHLMRQKTPITPYWSHSSAVSTPLSETKPFVNQPDGNNKEFVWKLSKDIHKMDISRDDTLSKYPILENDLDTNFQSLCFPCPIEVYTRPLEKAERLLTFVQNALEKNSVNRTFSLDNLSHANSIQNQYSKLRNNMSFRSKKSINLRRRKSIHDPLFPWFKREKLAASQCYVDDMLNGEFIIGRIEREECTFRELVTERKKSLTLPLKPHNASEPQKSDMKSPGGYCTPLMNKLSIPNLFKRQNASNDIPLAPFIRTTENRKTEEKPELQKCILFMQGKRDMVLAALLTKECLESSNIIERLHRLCVDQLPVLETQIGSNVGPPKAFTSFESDPYSILSLDSDWDTTKRMGPWDGPELNDLTRLHGSFKEHKDITDIYLRKPESMLYGHRDGPTEVFYQEPAPLSSGLLPVTDALGTVHQTAKKRLEKNHDVFIK